MNTEMAAAAVGSYSADARERPPSAIAMIGLAYRVARESMTGVGMLETQPGVLVAVATLYMRPAGLVWTRGTTEDGTTRRTATTSLLKAGFAWTVERNLEASLLILASCDGGLVGESYLFETRDLPLHN